MSNTITEELIALKGKEEYDTIYRYWNDKMQNPSIKDQWLKFMYHDLLPEKTIDELVKSSSSINNVKNDINRYIEKSIHNRFHEFNNKDEAIRDKLLKLVYDKTKKDLTFVTKKSEDCKVNLKKLIDYQIKRIIDPYTVEREKDDKYLLFKDNKVLDYDSKNDVSLQCQISNIILCKSFDDEKELKELTIDSNPFANCIINGIPTLKYWYLLYLLMTNLFSMNSDLSIFNDTNKLDKMIESILVPKSKEDKTDKTDKRKDDNIKKNIAKMIGAGKKDKKDNQKKNTKSAIQLWWTMGEASKIHNYVTKKTINSSLGKQTLSDFLFKGFLDNSKIIDITTLEYIIRNYSTTKSFTDLKNEIHKECNKNPFLCNSTTYLDSKFFEKYILEKEEGKIRQTFSSEDRRVSEMVNLYKTINTRYNNALPYMSLELYMVGSKDESKVRDKFEDRVILNNIIDFYIYLYVEKYKLYSNYIKVFNEQNISKYNIKTNSQSKENRSNLKGSNTKGSNTKSPNKINYNGIIKKLREEREKVETELFGTSEGNQKIKIINKLIENTKIAKNKNLGIII